VHIRDLLRNGAGAVPRQGRTIRPGRCLPGDLHRRGGWPDAADAGALLWYVARGTLRRACDHRAAYGARRRLRIHLLRYIPLPRCARIFSTARNIRELIATAVHSFILSRTTPMHIGGCLFRPSRACFLKYEQSAIESYPMISRG